MPRRLLVLVGGLVVFEFLARARMSGRPCCSVVEVLQSPSCHPGSLEVLSTDGFVSVDQEIYGTV